MLDEVAGGTPRASASTADRTHPVRSTRQFRRVVAASKPCECSAFACGEAEHECPDESGNLELAVAFDHAEFLGVLFEERRETV